MLLAKNACIFRHISVLKIVYISRLHADFLKLLRILLHPGLTRLEYFSG